MCFAVVCLLAPCGALQHTCTSWHYVVLCSTLVPHGTVWCFCASWHCVVLCSTLMPEVWCFAAHLYLMALCGALQNTCASQRFAKHLCLTTLLCASTPLLQWNLAPHCWRAHLAWGLGTELSVTLTTTPGKPLFSDSSSIHLVIWWCMTYMTKTVLYHNQKQEKETDNCPSWTSWILWTTNKL